MSEIAIRLRGLTKAYRLYRNSSDKAFGIFNIRIGRFGAYTEHLAIDHIDLDIRRGERVGIIGRNGSGKSTFLKLISRTTAPSSGLLEVHGDIHVLMNLGTGFHPDFTGRENSRAYLAQMGITGARTEALVEELGAFAELGKYFDQPLATYSSGMQVRLMFAASTVISPDILLLDEVLGVGDAYFVHKSFARLRALCTREGTTLLLVTHSPHMAAEICQRLIWIDAGRVMMDGEPLSVINAYEASIRDQEEQRLRQLNEHLADRWRVERQSAALATTLAETMEAEQPSDLLPSASAASEVEVIASASIEAREEAPHAAASATLDLEPPAERQSELALALEKSWKSKGDDGTGVATVLSGELQTIADQVPSGRLFIGRIRLLSGGNEVAVVDFDAPDRRSNIHAVDDRDRGNWGPPVVQEGRRARQYLRYGSVFHKLPVLVGYPLFEQSAEELSVDISYWADTPEPLAFSIFRSDGKSRLSCTLALGEVNRWHASRATLATEPAAVADNRARYGTRRVEIVDFHIFDAGGNERGVFGIGESVRIRINYRVNDPALNENPAFVIGFHRDGLQSTHRFLTNGFRIAAADARDGHVDAIASPLLLGPGRYTVTAAVFAERHLASREPKPYFAVSTNLYDMHARAGRLEVIATNTTNALTYDFVFQHPSRWVRNDVEEVISAFTGDNVVVDDRIYLVR